MYRLMPLSVTNAVFKGTPLFDVEYLIALTLYIATCLDFTDLILHSFPQATRAVLQ